MCNHLVSFERQMIRKAALMLKSLDYNPDEIDVRAVVSAFIENVDPERFESVLLGPELPGINRISKRLGGFNERERVSLLGNYLSNLMCIGWFFGHLKKNTIRINYRPW